MQQAHIFISGNVQGVGFRYFVRSNAKKLGLTGWVRNTEDGGVEAVLQSLDHAETEGEKKIAQMIALCKQGPFLAEVKQVGYEWEESNETYNTFAVQ